MNVLIFFAIWLVLSFFPITINSRKIPWPERILWVPVMLPFVAIGIMFGLIGVMFIIAFSPWFILSWKRREPVYVGGIKVEWKRKQ